MSDRVNHREATEADLPAVLALYARPEIDGDAVLEPDTAAEVFRRFAAYPDYNLYVAETDGRIVGSYALLVMDNLRHLGAKSAVIEDVVVDPVLHRRGIGRAMMADAVDRCRAKGCYKVALSSNIRSARAHAFYESLGFERHGISFTLSLD